MGELADKVKQRSPYLRLENGESIVATYKGYKMVPSTYDPDKENFRFILEIDVSGEKTIKYWDTGSNKVAIVFDTSKVGDQVRITKSVKETEKGKEQTSWDVVPLGEMKKSLDKK